VILTLKITAPSSVRPGETTRQVFTEEGGTIGRAGGNSWVLSHNKVSGHHAQISFRNGVFYIQDTSRNGVSVNSPDNRLVRDRPYALKSGDCIFIEPYEIDVSIGSGSDRPARHVPLVDPYGPDDPFAPVAGAPHGPPNLVSPPDGLSSSEVDPLKFFDPLNRTSPVRQSDSVAPPPDDWHNAHFNPPPARPDPSIKSEPGAIPQDYNPLAPDDSFSGAIPQLPPPPPRRPRPPEPAAVRPKKVVPPREPLPPPPVPPVQAIPEPVIPPGPPDPVPVAPPPPPMTVPPASAAVASGDLAEMLRGAGLHDAKVSPELARNFGEIFRIVVAGLMDVLQSRQRIKEEFRLRQTIFRPTDNNPLKFSANVDDALHNLLVKRNAAYLGPVDAFADAFDDLRNHQLAMLTGMRVAFEAMLAEFDADRLQDEFDRQLGKVSLPLVPAKMRYWDLYREKRREMAKDPEAAFADLFGEEFARAYEEQFRTLKAQRRGRAAGARGPDDDTLPPRE
jgi:type VI secretion system FHA domain protein